ncbi:MAG: hypothetical protein SCH71_17380 [Desulfobulbaceae bacterium]|nr:hypothetical protein [Desulfobulbaceae bacterium]
MTKEQFDRIAVLFEELFEMIEYLKCKSKNIPPENNKTADAIKMLECIKKTA